MSSRQRDEFNFIAEAIKGSIPPFLDGKDAILRMKEEGSANWRQMEWIGFWFEHFVHSQLKHQIQANTGPTYGTTTFDLEREFVWDLKSHPVNIKSLILNDAQAIKACINEKGGLGFVILSGDVSYDDEQMTFKRWHDSLKGGTSSYEKDRVLRNAPSRRRKTQFSPTKVEGIWFSSESEVESALASGVLGHFQKGMRNSNGKSRPEKIMIRDSSAIEKFLIGRKSFTGESGT
jgi:hypothetical protein